LTVEEAAQFAAQLPMLLQGVYYHGWTPRGKPEKMRSREEFLDRVCRQPGEQSIGEARRTVFAVLERRMPNGEIEDVKRILPKRSVTCGMRRQPPHVEDAMRCRNTLSVSAGWRFAAICGRQDPSRHPTDQGGSHESRWRSPLRGFRTRRRLRRWCARRRPSSTGSAITS
jgi:hypothetical protein